MALASSIEGEITPFEADIDLAEPEIQFNTMALKIIEIDKTKQPLQITAESENNIYIFGLLDDVEITDIPENLHVHFARIPVLHAWFYIQHYPLHFGSFRKVWTTRALKKVGFEMLIARKKSKLPLRERIGKFFTRKTRE